MEVCGHVIGGLLAAIEILAAWSLAGFWPLPAFLAAVCGALP